MHNHSSSEILVAEKQSRPFLGPRAAWKVSLAFAVFVGAWMLLFSQSAPLAQDLPGKIFLVLTFVLVFVSVQIFVSKASLIQKALRQSEERYRAFMATTADGIWRLELDRPMPVSLPSEEQIHWIRAHSRFHEVNRSFVRMMGFPSRDEVLGKSLNEAFSDEELPRWQSIDDFVNSDYHIINSEMVRELPNGDCRILLSSTIGVIEDDHLRRIWGTSTDITERRQAQMEAEQQRIQLIEADKMISLGTLVSGVAHEVNNPNQYILLNIKTLQSAWQDIQPVLEAHAQHDETFRIADVPYSEMQEELPKTMEEIQEGADRIRHIVSELRNYSRRQDSLEFTSVDVNEVVKAALTLIADPIKKATDRFSAVHAQHIPRIHGNLRRLEQVVINLVLNACQSTDDKSKAVTVETRFDSITRHALIEVRDAGSGISKEDLAHIQDPFFTTKRDSGGTGLGLAVSTRIVEEHQGQLTFESDVGKGTTARLSLPTERTEDRS